MGKNRNNKKRHSKTHKNKLILKTRVGRQTYSPKTPKRFGIQTDIIINKFAQYISNKFLKLKTKTKKSNSKQFEGRMRRNEKMDNNSTF